MAKSNSSSKILIAVSIAVAGYLLFKNQTAAVSGVSNSWKGFKKFMINNFDYVISLKTISEKRKVLNVLLTNLENNEYEGDIMSIKIATDNIRYALQQKTVSNINKVLKTSKQAF